MRAEDPAEDTVPVHPWPLVGGTMQPITTGHVARQHIEAMGDHKNVLL